jgi:hypothetical protein
MTLQAKDNYVHAKNESLYWIAAIVLIIVFAGFLLAYFGGFIPYHVFLVVMAILTVALIALVVLWRNAVAEWKRLNPGISRGR